MLQRPESRPRSRPSTPPTASTSATRSADAPMGYWQFARIVEALTAETRARGLIVPGFQSLAATSPVLRVRRRSRRGEVIAVVVRNRSVAAVVNDLVDGVLVVNGLGGEEATRCRDALLAVVHDEVSIRSGPVAA